MILHEGIVLRVDGSTVSVRIIKQSTCSGCHARGVCTAADQSEIVINVPDVASHPEVGRTVILEGSSTMGVKAVLLAFVIPLVLIITTLLLFNYWLGSETISGLIALLVLLPYYLVLHLMRDKLKRKFIFRIKST